jgi:DNA-binding GntR family transcriptional regulator
MTATQRATEGVRAMIRRHQLAPGQQVRQEELAERLGLSRSPLREALRLLESEGLVRHAPNQGYFVARLRADELRQVYRMRQLLETELLRSLPRPRRDELARLRALNDEVRAADGVAAVLDANQRFHFALFAPAQLDLVAAQTERLWNLAEPYQAAYVALPAARAQIVREHDGILRALAAYDVERLVDLADAHRAASEDAVLALLAGQDA